MYKKIKLKFLKKSFWKKNKFINLFSRKNPNSQLKFLFDQDLLTGKYLLPVLNQAKSPVLDIGSGNGFPGLLMGILYPKTLFYLCERNRKKAEFLKGVLSKAEIHNVKTLCQNAEKINKTFEIILSQAALSLEEMLKLLTKLLSQNGQAFFMEKSLLGKRMAKKQHFYS